MDQYLKKLGQQARRAGRVIASAGTKQKNAALLSIAANLRKRSGVILEANADDLTCATSDRLDAPLLDRLALNEKSIQSMVNGLEQVAALSDPVGEIDNVQSRPSGIQVGHMRVPLGVIGIIYESRPDVTANVAALCIKSGNAAILRGGKEALRTNRVIADCIMEGLSQAGLPAETIQVFSRSDHADVQWLVSSPAYVDIIIPRGGKGLVSAVVDASRVPVIKHLDGNCHVYVDDEADLEMAFSIVDNAKTHRFGVCNAAESLLIARSVASDWLPKMCEHLVKKGVEIRGCEETCQLFSQAKPATLDDWSTEYLAAILSVKVVDGIDGAIEHIAQYSSHHTDAIVTKSYHRARHFVQAVDSSSVIVNASTRFADGFEYGLGAEIGISTDKIHARGPVGLEGLTGQKWVVFGNGEIKQ